MSSVMNGKGCDAFFCATQQFLPSSQRRNDMHGHELKQTSSLRQFNRQDPLFFRRRAQAIINKVEGRQVKPDEREVAVSASSGKSWRFQLITRELKAS
jgi:hypothetical protein